MRVLIGGYLPGEGRFSIVRTAHSIARHGAPMLGKEDTIQLWDTTPLEQLLSSRFALGLRLHKRGLHPLRLAAARADVIHIIDNDYAFGIAPWHRRRTLVTCNDLMPYLLDPTLESIFPGRAGRWFYTRATQALARCGHVVCASEFTRREVLNRTATLPERASVVPWAVEPHFRPIPEGDADLARFLEARDLVGKTILLHVGVCAQYKNIDGLLEVFEGVVQALGDRVVLLKVGGRFSPEQLTRMDSAGLSGQIRHCTGLTDQELVLAYNAAHVLVWPSLFEGFGLPVLEAMACGTPFVCSNGGSLPEVAGDQGHVLDPRDSPGMIGACLRIVTDDAHRDELRAGGLGRAAEFTWERTVKAYCDIYRRLAGQSA